MGEMDFLGSNITIVEPKCNPGLGTLS